MNTNLVDKPKKFSNRSRSFKKFRQAFLYLGPIVFFIFLFFITPGTVMFLYSFLKFHLYRTSFEPTINNYIQAITDPVYIRVTWNAVQIGIMTAILSVAFSYPVAYYINFRMQPEMLESESIEVVAQRPIIQRDLTSTEAKVSGDEIAVLPIEDLAGIVNLQAGVVDGHFRGGRTSEVKYLIDGIER